MNSSPALPTTVPLMPRVNVDEALEAFFGPLVDVLESVVFFAVPVGEARLPLLVVWLFAGAVFLTVLVGFKRWRDLPHSLRIIRGH